jgi:hypothetical protein
MMPMYLPKVKTIKPVKTVKTPLNTMFFMSKGVKSCSSCH